LSLVDNGNLVAIKSQEVELLEKDLLKEEKAYAKENEKENVKEDEKKSEEPVVIIINESIEEENDTLQDNITLQEEFNIEDFKESENVTFRERITIGKPVRWVKNIKLNQSLSNLTFEIPREAKNLTIKKIENNVKTEIENNNIKVDNLGELGDIENTNLITGGAVINLNEILNWLKGITGFAVIENNKNITLHIQENVEEIEIEFETPGPVSRETNLNSRKRVTIDSSVEGYTNILSYTYLKDISSDDYGRIVVYWVNENRNVPYSYLETDDGLYVEWNVEHLSAQDFEVYLGEPFSSQNISRAGVYVNTESTFNYRNYTVARSNSTLYCNNLTTNIPTLSYNWYKNDAALNVNSSDLISSGNFTKGDLIYCQINGINSTDRFILDTTLGDFSNGTNVYVNQTYQSGNVSLNFNSRNIQDTLLLLNFDSNYTLNTNLTDDVSIYNNNGKCVSSTACPTFNQSGYIGGAFEFDGVDDYIQVTLSSVSNISKNQSMSLSFWVKRNGNGGTPQDIFEMLGGEYALEASSPSGTTYILFWGTGVAANQRGTITLTNDVWNNIVITWSNETRNVTLTQNGVQVINTGSGSDYTLTNFFFGSRAGILGFNGTIDEVAVWNRTLSDAEVSNLHNSYL